MKPSIVYVGAPWCGPCRVFKPIVKKWADANGVQVDFLDATEDADKVAELGVNSIPVTIFHFEGMERGRVVGMTGVAQLDALLREASVPVGSA